MADYISTLTGVQMDAALLDMAEHNSEAYAVGERNGIAVASDDVTYHNNARYYAQIASSQIVGDASSAVRWDTDQSEALTDAQKAQARENINAASDSDVVKITAQTLTTAQQSQARANIMAGGSNPNLLDNPFFSVNQRSFTTTNSNNTYTVDRWFLNNGGGTGGGATLTADGYMSLVGGSVYISFQQMFGKDELAGKTVTLSINDGGTIYQATGVVPARTSALQTALTFTYAAGKTFRLYVMGSASAYSYLPQISLSAGYSAEIRAVKLELGSVSTLANDAPPDYAEELAKCMRYFQRVKVSATMSVGFGTMTSGTEARVTIPLSVPLRSAPTVSVGEIGSFRIVSETQAKTPSSFTYLAYSPVGVAIKFVVSSGIAELNNVSVQINSTTAYIDLSADL